MLSSIKSRIVALGILVFLLVVYTAFNSPTASKMFTTVGFLLLVYLIIYLFSSIIVSLSLKNVSSLKLNVLSLVIALGPTYLLALASLNTIGLIDVVFVVITAVLFVWYLSKIID
ncbi:hypothetical protein KC874_03045 [Candidatus Saccharibacteria bacterium]|nr:hypothetical protein [Candidatus Saccharibacteria bacterium]